MYYLRRKLSVRLLWPVHPFVLWSSFDSLFLSIIGEKQQIVLISEYFLNNMFYNASYTIGESFSIRVLFSRCFSVVVLIISFYQYDKLVGRAPGPESIEDLLYVVAELRAVRVLYCLDDRAFTSSVSP